MADLKITLTPILNDAEALRTGGVSVMFLSVDGVLAGILAVSDPVKASTAEALAQLKTAGIRVVMATGDGITTANAVAAKLGIDEVHGEVKPKDKLDLVAKLQSEGAVVAMAGDGINDAPALAKADIGIERFFDAWSANAMRSRLEPIKKVVKMLRRHETGLLNFSQHRISNACAEGFNNAIQLIKAMPVGFVISPTTEQGFCFIAVSWIWQWREKSQWN